jgi:hypothetical protein
LLSAPVAGGKVTETSIGVPSQLGVTVPVALPHWRWPACGPDATLVQAIEPNTFGIAAAAARRGCSCHPFE